MFSEASSAQPNEEDRHNPPSEAKSPIEKLPSLEAEASEPTGHYIQEDSLFPQHPLFDAQEELLTVRKKPASERRQALAEFRERLAAQLQSIADVQASLIDTIERQPDIDEKSLLEFVSKATKQAGFTPSQTERAQAIAQRYIEGHTAVTHFRNENPDDQQLFEKLFEFKPKGHVEISEKPLCLYVRCFEYADYAAILECSKLGGMYPDGYQDSGGFVDTNSKFPEINGKLVIENTDGTEEEKAQTQAHELQHIIHQLFLDRTFRQNHPLMELTEQLNERDFKSPRIKRIPIDFLTKRQQKLDPLLLKSIQDLDQESFEYIQSEILAFTKEGLDDRDILHTLLANYITKYVDNTRSKLAFAKYLLPSHINQRLLKLAQNTKMDDRAAYRSRLAQYASRGLLAVYILRLKEWPDDKIISLLMNVELKEWRQIARHAGQYKQPTNLEPAKAQSIEGRAATRAA